MNRSSAALMAVLTMCLVGAFVAAAYFSGLVPTTPKPAMAMPAMHASVQYDVQTDRECFGPCEFYLAITYSCQPDVQQLLPVNMDGMTGHGFVNLAVPLERSSTVKFTLLDADTLSSADEELLKDAFGFGRSVFLNASNKAAAIVPTGILKEFVEVMLRRGQPFAELKPEHMADCVIVNFNLHPFDIKGYVDYVVPEALPPNPRGAFEFGISEPIPLVGIKISRIALRVYEQSDASVDNTPTNEKNMDAGGG